MKKLLFLLCILIIMLVVSNADYARLPVGARELIEQVALPFKLARLSMQEPDNRIAIPVEGVTVKQIVDTWGASRSGGRVHEGQDIFAVQGTQVRSATEGYVVRVGENSLGGKTVFVMGAGGRRYYYAHLDDYARGLSLGDYVTPQTLIGYVGTTGNAKGTPPHLHFGVYTTGGAIDPLPLLSKVAVSADSD